MNAKQALIVILLKYKLQEFRFVQLALYVEGTRNIRFGAKWSFASPLCSLFDRGLFHKSLSVGM